MVDGQRTGGGDLARPVQRTEQVADPGPEDAALDEAVERLLDDIDAGHRPTGAVIIPVPRVAMTSVAEVRSTVRDVVAAALPPSQAFEVQLVTSELVTNAIIHGEPPVRLLLHEGPDDVVVAVFDRGAGRPRPDGDPVGGLRIVADVAGERWGVWRGRGGKWVWARVGARSRA
jgi:hypothetical protein